MEKAVPRPRKFTSPINKTVTLEETELRAIKDEARRQGESTSALIRRLLLTALGVKPTDTAPPPRDR